MFRMKSGGRESVRFCLELLNSQPVQRGFSIFLNMLAGTQQMPNNRIDIRKNTPQPWLQLFLNYRRNYRGLRLCFQ